MDLSDTRFVGGVSHPIGGRAGRELSLGLRKRGRKEGLRFCFRTGSILVDRKNRKIGLGTHEQEKLTVGGPALGPCPCCPARFQQQLFRARTAGGLPIDLSVAAAIGSES